MKPFKENKTTPNIIKYYHRLFGKVKNYKINDIKDYTIPLSAINSI
jgi:hypothetical protein